jgi:hypothetical protein
MWRGCKTDAQRRGDTRAEAGGIPRPRQGAPGAARGQGESRGYSSGDLLIATVEAVVAGAMAAAHAASALPGGTRGADHARALRVAAAAVATAAGVAAELLVCHVAWLSEAEAGLRRAPPPRPNASPTGEAGPSPGRGSARTVSRRMRHTRPRDAAGLQAEAEVAEGGAEESAPPASCETDQDVRQESQIPAEHRQPDTEITSGGGDERDGQGTDSASSWDTVEDDGGAELEGRWKAAVVFGTAADRVDGQPGDGEPDAADRPIVVRPVGVLSSAGAAVAGAGRPTWPRGDGSRGAAAARAAAARAAAVERGRCAFARILGARSVGMRGGFPSSPAAKKKPRVIDHD